MGIYQKIEKSCGRWTSREHKAFLRAIRRNGKKWKKISSEVITRTPTQVRTHAQKYAKRLEIPERTMAIVKIHKRDSATQFGEGIFFLDYRVFH